MKRFSHYRDLARQDTKPRVVTIGNFDGVHIGHQAVLRAARKEADRLGLALAVLKPLLVFLVVLLLSLSCTWGDPLSC